VQDTLLIQCELTTMRGQIEQVQGRIQYFEESSDMAQIFLRNRPVASLGARILIVAKACTASHTVLQALAAGILSTLVFGW
jgi:hypothetical protein